MTLVRMISLFLGALVLMLAVVVLRAETTRLHYEMAELDRQEDVLRQELRQEDLALQRARSPALLLERVKQLRLGEAPQPTRAGAAHPPAAEARPRRGEGRPAARKPGAARPGRP